MNKQNGIVANWNEEKGFGFIDPEVGDRRVFAHVTDYSKGHEKPFKGLEVQYFLSTDQRGRKRAVEVSPSAYRFFRNPVLSL
ncbi:MAG: cold shock CspA family protein [Desulforhopalus sp.]|jgi:cold shock CspA family protein